MKTAEEIITEEWKDYDLKAETFKNLAIKAMKFYANQKLEKAASKVKWNPLLKQSIRELKDNV